MDLLRMRTLPDAKGTYEEVYFQINVPTFAAFRRKFLMHLLRFQDGRYLFMDTSLPEVMKQPKPPKLDLVETFPLLEWIPQRPGFDGSSFVSKRYPPLEDVLRNNPDVVWEYANMTTLNQRMGAELESIGDLPRWAEWSPSRGQTKVMKVADILH